MVRFIYRLLVIAALLAACTTPSPPDAADAGSDTGGNDVAGEPSGNQPPSLAAIGDKRAVVGESLVIFLRASDPDSDVLEFSVVGDLPLGAKFDKEAARFNWTPAAGDLGSEWLITFTVSDGELSDRETITITVGATGDNSPPSFIDPGDQVLPVNVPYELLLEATDPDGDVLRFSINGVPPEGSTFDGETGRFGWTPPPEAEDNTFRVLFQVSDGTAIDDLFINFRVGSAAISFPPIPPQEVVIGELLNLELVVINPAGQSYTCSVLGTPPAGSEFNPDKCRFTWTPNDESLIGQAIQVPFEVSDGTANLVQTASISVLRASTGECVADQHEADEAANGFAAVGAGEITGLTICGDDYDVVGVELTTGQEFEVTVTFEHDVLDIDMEVYAPSDYENAYRTSDGVTDSETIRLDSTPETGRWAIAIYGADTGDSTYTLSITINDSAACSDDGYEENDLRADAHAVESGVETSAQYCLDDADWYQFSAQAGQTVTANLVSSDDVDLDLALYAPGATSAGWNAWAAGATEELHVASLPATGRYDLEVYSVTDYDSAYRLTVTVSGSTCEPDAYEAGAGNDVEDSATELTSGQTLEDLTFCDHDWYWFIGELGDEFQVGINYDFNTYADPTVVLKRSGVAESLGVLEYDSLGLTISLDSAPSESIYVVGVTDGDVGMPYEVEFTLFPAN